MFPRSKAPILVQHALDALRLTHSFLFGDLRSPEYDYDVGWEVDRDEPPVEAHPHRALLHGRLIAARRAPRRPGQPSPPHHVCLSPVCCTNGAACPPSSAKGHHTRSSDRARQNAPHLKRHC